MKCFYRGILIKALVTSVRITRTAMAADLVMYVLVQVGLSITLLGTVNAESA